MCHDRHPDPRVRKGHENVINFNFLFSLSDWVGALWENSFYYILSCFVYRYGLFCRSLQEPSVGVNAHCHLNKKTDAIHSKIPRYARSPSATLDMRLLNMNIDVHEA